MALSGKTVSLEHILERVHRDYGFEDIYTDEAAEWIWDVVGLIGTPKPLEDAIPPAKIDIEDYRGVLPVDLYKITMVREYDTGIACRLMTDQFFKSDADVYTDEQYVTQDYDPATGESYYTSVGPESRAEYFTYKTQGNYIYTGFQTGIAEVSYKKFPIDVETGLPVIPDNIQYIRAVVDYIAWKMAFRLNLKDMISDRKLDRIEQQYLHSVGAAESQCVLPDLAEYEVLKNRLKSPYPYHDHFDTGFRYLGNRQ